MQVKFKRQFGDRLYDYLGAMLNVDDSMDLEEAVEFETPEHPGNVLAAVHDGAQDAIANAHCGRTKNSCTSLTNTKLSCRPCAHTNYRYRRREIQYEFAQQMYLVQQCTPQGLTEVSLRYLQQNHAGRCNRK
jgi:hypothetical protein